MNDIELKFVQTWFSDPEQREKRETHDKELDYYSKSRIGMLVTFIQGAFSIIMIIVPVTLLYVLRLRNWANLLIIVLSALLFSMGIPFFTRAKRHEGFAITAAYVSAPSTAFFG